MPTRLEATRRCTAVAIALASAALAAAGCGLGPGEELGEVELTVTRDYGAESLFSRPVGDASESDTVMRVLERNADISTRYGGGFVQAIDELEADRRDGRFWDWLYYVNGVEAGVGAAEYELQGGEAIWWDYRDWTDAQRVPAVVGSWPQPFVDGYEGERRPVAIECLPPPAEGGEGEATRRTVVEACRRVRAALELAGADAGASGGDDAIRVLIGLWDRVRRDPAAALLESGPQASGVFVDFVQRPSPSSAGGMFRLWGLDESGEAARAFDADAGLVAATRRYDAPPTWVVTGVSASGVRAATTLLNTTDLRDHYAVVTEDGEETPLPVR